MLSEQSTAQQNDVIAKHTHLAHGFHKQAAQVSCAAVVHIYISKNRYNHDLQMTIMTQWTKFMENAFGGVLKYLENDAHTP